MAIGEKAKLVARRVGKAYIWSIAGDWREVRENFGRVSDRLAALRNPKYRAESFDEAVIRLGLTQEQLHRRHDQLFGLSVIYALIVIVALGFLCATSYSPHPVSHALMSIGVMAVSGSKFIAARFRVAQIRAGRLFGFRQWLIGRTDL